MLVFFIAIRVLLRFPIPIQIGIALLLLAIHYNGLQEISNQWKGLEKHTISFWIGKIICNLEKCFSIACSLLKLQSIGISNQLVIQITPPPTDQTWIHTSNVVVSRWSICQAATSCRMHPAWCHFRTPEGRAHSLFSSPNLRLEDDKRQRQRPKTHNNKNLQTTSPLLRHALRKEVTFLVVTH